MSPSQDSQQETLNLGKLQDKCIRCGKCCNKGGPALHLEDKDLVDQKHLPLHHLFTIREGEPVLDNVKDRLIWAPSDIIKIKGISDSWACTYFDRVNKSCQIYQKRPIECRIFKCWDPTATEQQYGKDYLTRKDLLASVEGLWSLIQEHQKRVCYQTTRKYLEKSSDLDTVPGEEQMLEMISFDKIVRAKTVDKIQIDPRWIDFLFGQPLTSSLKRLGVNLILKNNRYRLSKANRLPG